MAIRDYNFTVKGTVAKGNFIITKNKTLSVISIKAYEEHLQMLADIAEEEARVQAEILAEE